MPITDEAVFRQAVEAVPSGIVLCDDAGLILFANPQVEKVFGYPTGTLAGQPLAQLLPEQAEQSGDEGHRTRGTLRPSAAAASVVRDGRRSDGSPVPVQVRVTAVPGDPSRTIVSIVDVSDRAEFERQIDQSAAEQMAFDRLLAELAARFVNLEAERFGETLVDSLRQICELLDLDRSTIWYPNSAHTDQVAVYSWARPEYRAVRSGESVADRVPWMQSQLQAGGVVAYERVDELPPEDRAAVQRFGNKSGIAVPFPANDLQAILGFSAIRAERSWPPEIVERLRLIAAVFGQAFAQKERGDSLRLALAQLGELRDQLALENVQLRTEMKRLSVPRLVVAESDAVRRVLEQIDAVAPTDATVLLLGETGSGKEVFAQAIHRASERYRRPMITVNCAAIPATLVESELFGRERGAFTGALARQVGRFELAHDSTIFLDEIGELPLEAQVKLLRVLQEKVIERLGGGLPVKVNVRIIAATNRDLEQAIKAHTFREDLYYRLNVFPITIPPLRERTDDIPALTWTFVEEYATAFRKPIDSIAKESLQGLQQYAWPGNVRELRNVVERAIIVAKGPRLVIDLPRPAAAAAPTSTRLADIEEGQIRSVLERVGWKVRGRGGAAELLGMNPNTLDSRMVKLGIRRPGR